MSTSLLRAVAVQTAYYVEERVLFLEDLEVLFSEVVGVDHHLLLDRLAF
jgi:hypothetical protein